ncbi:hypothetical protein B484DRAFT_279908 [Ochromonadaceae sp. CCMP2298]|nr:hypothetical protein B484DRAFT_279908 [Ochromonadaceae sp. CCMP2298]
MAFRACGLRRGCTRAGRYRTAGRGQLSRWTRCAPRSRSPAILALTVSVRLPHRGLAGCCMGAGSCSAASRVCGRAGRASGTCEGALGVAGSQK